MPLFQCFAAMSSGKADMARTQPTTSERLDEFGGMSGSLRLRGDVTFNVVPMPMVTWGSLATASARQLVGKGFGLT